MTPQIQPEYHFLPWWWAVALLALAGLFAVLTSLAVLKKDRDGRLS